MSTGQQVDPMIGRLVDARYRVRARIARGGMATVYVATDLRLERRVALKVMHGHLTDDAVFQSRFIQEARSAARLANPHVVNVFDQGSDDGLAYLVMEYLPGITLRDLLREQRRLSPAQVITIMDATLTGLAAAHRAGIVHRDVKPENILLAEDGRIKIGDFGLARATTANTASGQMLLGTIAYLAPELVTRGSADARSDIYALGILMYEMLVGEQPYQGEQPMQIAYQHANDTVPRPSARVSQVPEQLDELVLWATEREPDDRPADAQEMLDRLRALERELDLEPVATHATSSIPTVDPGGSGEVTRVLPASGAIPTQALAEVDHAARLRRKATSRRNRRAWTGVLIVLLAALAALGGWWFGSGPGSLVTVADVRNLTMEEAVERLATDTLVARGGVDEYSLEVETGRVISTIPQAGARIDKSSPVSIILSLGPRPTTFDQALAGQPESVVRELLAAAEVGVDDEVATQFSGDSPADTVLGVTVVPRGTDEQIDAGQAGAIVHQGDRASLLVSLGPAPDVIGLEQQQATAELAAVDLGVSEVWEEFSGTVSAGTVMDVVLPDGALTPGAAVILIVSKGPEPIAVPDVNGWTIREAVNTLQNAGFRVNANIDDVELPLGLGSYWDIYRVVGVNPGIGTLQPPDTVINLTPGGALG